jgi:hypothetical protein
MIVRPLDLLDISSLPRYRNKVLPLYNARILTRGNPLGAMAMLSYLDPRRYIYTAIASNEGDSLMGQVILNTDETSARLTFMAPLENINGLTLTLLDHLSMQAGEWKAFHLLAEADENSPVFRSLRQSGFAVYAWQRIWKLPRRDQNRDTGTWHQVNEIDWPAVQSLHGQIVPPLIQPVDTLPKQASGLVCRSEGQLQAYVTVTRGPRGVWYQPLVPPDCDCGPERLSGLSGSGNRPVYVCVRSYQAWLETALEDLGAEAGPRQAVMVRRLVKTIKEQQPISVMEKVLAKAKPAAPVSRIDNNK